MFDTHNNLTKAEIIAMYNNGLLDNENDIMMNMLDGKTDPIVSEIYAEDIQMVENITYAKIIAILFYDCDLDDDGIMDKIVIVGSPLHTGSGGDSLDFLIGNSDGSYSQISGQHARLLAQGEGYLNASMYILDCITNGFRDILICDSDGTDLNEQDTVLLKYENGRYRPSK